MSSPGSWTRSCPEAMPEPVRPHPFELALGPFAPGRLEAIRLALAGSEIDPFDQDAWPLARPVAELLHELRPDDGLGEAVAELVSLVHAGYLYWQHGERTTTLERSDLDRLRALVADAAHGRADRAAYYVQAPARRIWGTPVPDAPPEPLDGWFAVAHGSVLRIVAVFGLLPGRPGFTVAQVQGPPPGPIPRADGSAMFEAVLPGGRAAGLWSLVGQGELLELGWRVHQAPVANTVATVMEDPTR
jgi:hypothetical protein